MLNIVKYIHHGKIGLLFLFFKNASVLDNVKGEKDNYSMFIFLSRYTPSGCVLGIDCLFQPWSSSIDIFLAKLLWFQV